MPDTLPDRVRFGGFELDLRAGELRKEGHAARLQEKPLRVLRLLVERGGDLVTREELQRELWPDDTIVDFEHGINTAIKKLRQALADSPEAPTYIETIPRRGYRLMVPVKWAAAEVSRLEARVPVGADAGAAARLQPEPAALTGRTVSHYRVLDVIGGGGMGVVYRAEDLKLGRRVALKFLPEELGSDSQALERFSREARAISSLDHPNICSIYEFGEHEGRPFMVMQFLEGQTLRDRLAALAGAPTSLPIEELLNIAIQVCDGLQAAHEKGIIHRDIKPANIFVTSKGTVKILDFGLVKLLEASEAAEAPDFSPANPTDVNGIGLQCQPEKGRGFTQVGGAPDVALSRTGIAMGTAGYMSPEQVRGEQVDARSDLFSFGLVLYEMATGQRAFTGETAAVVHDAILNAAPVSACELNSSLPTSLVATIEKALRRDREERYQSAAEMRADLQRLSRDTESRDIPAAIGILSKRFLLKGLGAALILLLFVAAASWWIVSKRKPTEAVQITQRQITANSPDNPVRGAVISRDGKYLAYGDDNGLFIEEIENGNIHKLPGTAGLLLQDWYPDGLHLLVIDNDKNLWSLFAFSGEKHKLASSVTSAGISRDGLQIMLTLFPRQNELWTMPVAGGEPRKRITLGQDDIFMNCDWSPDGKAIACIRSTKSYLSGTLEIRNLEGGEARVLLTDNELTYGGPSVVSWLPDNRILFALMRGVLIESDLWAISLDSKNVPTGKPVRLTNTAGQFFSMTSVSQDGKRLVVEFLRNPLSTFVGSLGKTEGKLGQTMRLTNDSAWPRAWSLDGQTLFYSSPRGSGKVRLYARRWSPDSTDLFLSGPEGLESATVSPDGTWLVVTAQTGGKGVLLRIPVSGGAPETILERTGRGQVWCAPFGSRICLFSEMVEKEMVLSSFDPMRGRLAEVARIDAPNENLTWSLSPDGSRIALVENLADNVRILDLKTKETRVIHPIPPHNGLQFSAWSADGQRLFLTDFPQPRGELLEMDMQGHARLLLENRHGWIGCPLPSTDGKRIAYRSQLSETNVMLLEHF